MPSPQSSKVAFEQVPGHIPPQEEDLELECGMDYEPAVLAREGLRRRRGRAFSIPLPVALLGILTLLLAAVVVPSSTVFVTNAKRNAEDDASTILNLTTIQAVASIEGIMNKYYRAAYNIGARTTAKKAMSASVFATGGGDWSYEVAETLTTLLYRRIANPSESNKRRISMGTRHDRHTQLPLRGPRKPAPASFVHLPQRDRHNEHHNHARVYVHGQCHLPAHGECTVLARQHRSNQGRVLRVRADDG
ncbi:uncharacterized protein EV422DRAFT_266455 [Fimicolochytrium jonesii]|uniref:uncharacterized protein n=1 Tax=Fimicolochytrium jonesii TaxID=1396493 RepID=UPI0022FDF6D1|nr:uncharacterized protein EV422DRAFT_266455 [Fimicolochytrium jonesii]KAI8816944.1 hypothetical protein EV422DRAFT_266455 [Fimicolochytrium jonesii]